MTRMATAQELVERYALLPHPEGGFFRESYRSAEQVDLPRGRRSASTAIYFLLPRGTKSRLHRIKSDEVWHFYLGGPLRLTVLSEEGAESTVVLGPDAAQGQLLQFVVPAGSWFGGRPEGDYAFVGCTVAPGFDFADFELGERAELVARYPKARAVIEALT